VLNGLFIEFLIFLTSVTIFRLPYRGKIYYNILSHNRVITMTHSDYFYITEASKSDIFAGFS